MEKDFLVKVFDESTSIAEICMILYGKKNGGMHNRVIKLFKETGYDWDKHLTDIENSKKRYCLNCGKEISGKERNRKKFCCQSCSTKYNNRLRKYNDNTKSAISEGLKRYWSEHPMNEKEKYDKYCKDKENVSFEEYLERKERRHRRNNKKYYCVVCGKELKPNQSTYCSSECRKEAEDKLYREYIERWKKGEEPGHTASYKIHKYVKRYLLEKYNNSCQECGWSKKNPYTDNVPLQIHHIDGDCTNNSETNLQLLCPNCHALTENFGSRNKNSKRIFRKQKLFKQEIIE